MMPVFSRDPRATSDDSSTWLSARYQTVKAAFDLYAPVSGAVKAVNVELSQKPEIVSQDPCGKGWMVEIEVADASQAQRELNSLMDVAAYEQHCRSQQKH